MICKCQLGSRQLWINPNNNTLHKFISLQESTQQSQSNYSSTMNQVQEPVIRILISSATYPIVKILDNLLKDHNLETQCYNPSRNANSVLKQIQLKSTDNRAKKLVERTESFALRIREHVRLGPRISETLKGKLNLGVMIGGVTKVFNQKFMYRSGNLSHLVES